MLLPSCWWAGLLTRGSRDKGLTLPEAPTGWKSGGFEWASAWYSARWVGGFSHQPSLPHQLAFGPVCAAWSTGQFLVPLHCVRRNGGLEPTGQLAVLPWRGWPWASEVDSVWESQTPMPCCRVVGWRRPGWCIQGMQDAAFLLTLRPSMTVSCFLPPSHHG